MNTLKTLFFLAMLIGLAITLAATTSEEELTCDKDPKVCHVKGRGGPDCCNNKCVSLPIDRFNCGRCGKKCSFGKRCCERKCVNPRTNEKHCGKCGNKCNTGTSCVYGKCAAMPKI